MEPSSRRKPGSPSSMLPEVPACARTTRLLPDQDCPLCPRLAAFRTENRNTYPDYFNAPVPSFGDLSAELLVVGLAPGLKGANRTGRPFTGDYAGLVLYASLKKFGFAEGEYSPERIVRGEDRGARIEKPLSPLAPCPSPLPFRLIDCRITNAVRCVPPQNKPEPAEIRQCNRFLAAEIAAMPNLKVLLSLGQISHKAVIMALGLKQSVFAFSHGAEHHLTHKNRNLLLIDSYHCSRYNINTGVLTQAMFDDVVKRASALI